MPKQGFDPVNTYYFLQDGGGAFAIEDVDRFWQTLMADGDHEGAAGCLAPVVGERARRLPLP